jgi:hypothetical protein
MATDYATLRTLPDDVLQRVLVGVPLDDHRVTASVCRAFRAVICGPRFLALRRGYGFLERGIVVVKSHHGNDVMVCVVDKSVETPIISEYTSSSAEYYPVGRNSVATDGGTRLFVSIASHAGSPHVLAVDVASRKWSRFATLPLHQYGATHRYCIEWHDGRLYVAAWWRGDGPRQLLNSFNAFNEATGLWEELPSMPHRCWCGISGVIGNELFVAGGEVLDVVFPFVWKLPIYDIATRTWRLGAPLPRFGSHADVVDGKLFVFAKNVPSVMVYDPPSNTWTVEPNYHVEHACVHNDRIVVFSYDGTAYERATDGSWHPYEVAEPGKARHGRASESVILG